MLTGQSGISIVEVLVAALVVGITITGVAIMYGHGTSWMAAMGDDRVALSLAQERIENVRAAGWASDMAAPGITLEEEVRPAQIPPTRTDKAKARAYRRITCVQRVQLSSPPDPRDLASPGYDPSCPPGPADSDAGVITTRRITVVVVPVVGDGAAGSPASPQSSTVTLQGWITSAEP